LAFGVQCPDHLVRQVGYANLLACGVFGAKQIVPDLAAFEADVCRPVDIVLRVDCALVDIPALNIEVFRRDTTIRRVPILVPVDDLYGIVDIG
jgi:hypothetical protein